MNFTEILGTGLIAGIVVQAIQFMRDLHSDRKLHSRTAKRQAFDLSNKLKALSIRYEAVIGMHQLEQAPPDQEAPDPPVIPDFDFLDLTKQLSNLADSELTRIADLAIQQMVEESYLEFGWSVYMGLDEVGEFQLKRLKFLKEEAEGLADLVRKKYRLPAFGNHNRLIVE